MNKANEAWVLFDLLGNITRMALNNLAARFALRVNSHAAALDGLQTNSEEARVIFTQRAQDSWNGALLIRGSSNKGAATCVSTQSLLEGTAPDNA